MAPLLALVGCGAPAKSDLAEAQHRYLAAKAACDEQYPGSLTLQADCRTHAANVLIRPWYRYGDLMTYAQERRRVLAVEADQHTISRVSYQRQLALTEREVSRQEDRRNRLAHTTSSYESTPLTPMIAGLARIFD